MSTESRSQPLRLGSIAPDFEADTTTGPIKFHEWLGNSWGVLFSELGAFAKLSDEFEKRGVKMIGLSADDVESHNDWVKDINELSQTNLRFPIIADQERKVAYLYDMVDYQDTTNVDKKGTSLRSRREPSGAPRADPLLGMALTIRTVFVIDPSKKIRLTMMYPASTGRNAAEVLRVIDSLQTGDKNGVTTPINWTPGDDVIVPPTVSTEAAKKKFGESNVREVKPYLRYTTVAQ
ncbi:MAG: hypothetical protein M1817_000158 [Caeruleum heppii]|nr:MAG: hypothetical protein M1817_000158 [Caeruleum heppii]